MDVTMMFKGNNGYGFLYASRKESLRCRLSKHGGPTARDTGTASEGVQCGGRHDNGGGEDQIQESGSRGIRKQYVNCKGVYCAM